MCDQLQKPEDPMKGFDLSIQQVVIARDPAPGSNTVQWVVPGIVALEVTLPNTAPRIGQVSAVKVGDHWYIRPPADTEALLNLHFKKEDKTGPMSEDVATQLLAHLGGTPKNDFFGYKREAPKVQFDEEELNVRLDKQADTAGEALP